MKSVLTTSIAAYSLFFAALPSDSAEISIDVGFSAQEASIIREYYRQNPVAGTNGKNRAKSLPPGIAKNLDRGKPLPPGIAKQVLPAALLDKLPPTPRGYERIVLDGKVLLVNIATQIIHDILTDAVLHQ
jgi:hypothetical protein